MLRSVNVCIFIIIYLFFLGMRDKDLDDDTIVFVL